MFYLQFNQETNPTRKPDKNKLGAATCSDALDFDLRLEVYGHRWPIHLSGILVGSTG